MTRKTLALLVGVLLLQLFIRAHQITLLPVFTDEGSHIRRAAVIYDFDRHPAVESRGKFLFYFLPGIFNLKDNETALHLARTSVTLASLITTAVIFLICRTLFNERAGVAAALFYALLPYAFFFERMALADPWAGLMATITVWMAIRFARRPNHWTTLWLGTFMAFTIAAKLTMSFVAMIPAFTVLLLGNYTSFKTLWRHYALLSAHVLLIVTGWWSLVLIPATIAYQNDGVGYILYDNWLADPEAASTTVSHQVGEWWERMRLWMSLPLTLIWIACVLVILWKAPRRGGVIVGWLTLAWFPIFFVVSPDAFQSRYLMAGVPAVAALLGIGCVLLGEWLLKKRAVWLPVGVIGLWAVLFALPFAQLNMTAPERLDLPARDEKDYFGGRYNAWAILDAFQYLEKIGQSENQPIYTFLYTHYCVPHYYKLEYVEYICGKNTFEANEQYWAELRKGHPIYLIVDGRYSILQDERFVWDELAAFHKPEDGLNPTIWVGTLHLKP